MSIWRYNELGAFVLDFFEKSEPLVCHFKEAESFVVLLS